MRIQKYLSRAGVASRREAEAMVEEGRVRINGVVSTTPGTRIDPERDRIELDGEPVSLPRPRWIRFHKPSGVLTTAKDTHGRTTVYDCLPSEHGALRYVGRLDMDTEGLLLLTNDGDLAHRLQHPASGVEREYDVRVRGTPATETIERLRRGVELDDGFARPKSVIPGPPVDGCGTLRLVLTEGRKREVRRLMKYVGHPVVWLRRNRFGPVVLGRLPKGEWKSLSHGEIRALGRCIDEADPNQRVS